MRWLRPGLVLYGFLVLAAGASALAETVTISGVVVDHDSGKFLRGVRVTAAGGQGKRPAVTDDKGRFLLELEESIQLGTPVRIRGELEGYEPFDLLVAASALTEPIRLKKKPPPEKVEDLSARKPRPATPNPSLTPIDHFMRELLQSQDPSARKNAAEALGTMGTEARAAGPALARSLREDPDLSVRVVVARAMQKMGLQSRDAVTGLIVALKEGRSAELRQEAARTLGAIGPTAREALPALRIAFMDVDPEVQLRAAEAYVEIDSTGCPELDALLARLNFNTRALVVASRLNPPPKALVPLLLDQYQSWYGDESPQQRVLKKIGSKGLPELQAVLAEGKSLRGAIWYANHLIATDLSLKPALIESFRAFVAGLETGRIAWDGTTAWDRTTRTTAEGVRTLLALDPDAGAFAARALVALVGMKGFVSVQEDRGSGRKVTYSIMAQEIGEILRTIGPPAIPALREGLAQHRDDLDRAAWPAGILFALDANAAPEIATFLGDQIDRLGGLTEAAAELLMSLGSDGASAAPALIRRLQPSKPCETVLIAQALSAVAPEAPGFIDFAKEFVTRTSGWIDYDDSGTCTSMLFTLTIDALLKAKALQAEIAPTLVETLGAHTFRRFQESEIKSALGAMGTIAMPSLLAALREEVERVEANPNAKEDYSVVKPRLSDILDVLGTIGPAAKDAVPLLIRIIEADSDPVEALGAIGPAARESVPALVRAFRKVEGWKKARIAMALGKIGADASEAIPVLERELRRSTDKDVRAAVREALDKIRQPASPAGASDH